jgi:two-component system sensor histidine kinase TctE
MSEQKTRAKPYSLRARLLMFLLIPMVIQLGVSIVTDYRAGLDVANEAYDHALYNSALALAALVDSDPADTDLDLPAQAEAILRIDMADEIFYAVIDGSGKLLAGDAQMVPLARPGRENPSYRFDELNKQTVRIATYREAPNAKVPHGVVIAVAETTHKREATASRAMVTAVFGDLLFMLTALVVVFVGVRYAHRPLAHISSEIQAREPDDLRAIDESVAPTEIHALIRAMNRLMSNLRKAGIAQQNFISAAAHQLRSPLAALQTQMDLAAEGSQGDAQQRLRDMQASATRLARLTQQMLAFARAAPDATLNVEFVQVNLEELLENAASEFIDQAVLARIDLGFELAPVQVRGVAWSLREMLSNLIDNALRYTGEGGAITVRCGVAENGSPYIEVEDNGPGIPEAMRASVFGRFVRLSEMPGGSGLGLSIVKEVADAHHAHVTLDSGEDGRGLRVRVLFPVQQGRV